MNEDEENYWCHSEQHETQWCDFNADQAIAIAREQSQCCWMYGQATRTYFGQGKLEIAG